MDPIAHCPLQRDMLIVLGMQHSGIGGGGFMLIRDSDGNYESIGMISCRLNECFC